MVFRPQNVTVNPISEPVETADIRIPGRIRRREFLGSLVRYGVDADGDTILVDDPHRKGHQLFDIGDDVSLSLSREQVVLLGG